MLQLRALHLSDRWALAVQRAIRSLSKPVQIRGYYRAGRIDRFPLAWLCADLDTGYGKPTVVKPSGVARLAAELPAAAALLGDSRHALAPLVEHYRQAAFAGQVVIVAEL